MSTVRHLTGEIRQLPGRVLDLAREDASFLSPIVDGSPHIQAEVVYCVREEMAVCIEDILSRRLGLQFYDWRLAIHAAPIVGQILARELGWSRRILRSKLTGTSTASIGLWKHSAWNLCEPRNAEEGKLTRLHWRA